MHPFCFPGSYEVKKPPSMTDEQCMSVWAIDAIDSSGVPFFVTAWKPNKEDIDAINRGEAIYIKIVGNRIPPMLLFTFDESGKVNFS